MALVTHVLPVTAKKDQAELVVNITAKGSLTAVRILSRQST